MHVELYTGMVNAKDSLIDAKPLAMSYKYKKRKDYIFEGNLPFTKSGRIGYSVRILPSNPDMATYQDLMLVEWASQ